eukprot:7780328-Pyramimonas_sp.AAC.1
MAGSQKLFKLFAKVGKTMKGDTQEVEGVSSVVAIETKTAPSISLPLLTSRVNMAKRCGLGARSAKWKWSSVKDAVAVLWDEA